jgi:DNA-directed RNA polymerase specialized sigma24 family protein
MSAQRIQPDERERAEDEMVLKALWMRDVEGCSYEEIARALRASGMSRNAWLGRCRRIDQAVEKSEHAH